MQWKAEKVRFITYIDLDFIRKNKLVKRNTSFHLAIENSLQSVPHMYTFSTVNSSASEQSLLIYIQFTCLYRRQAPIFSSALPLNVPSPKWIPIANGVTVDSMRHGDDPPRGHSELPQWIGEHDGTDVNPTEIKSSTMHGNVMRSSHDVKNCFGVRFVCTGASRDRLKRAARVINDPIDSNDVKSSSRLSESLFCSLSLSLSSSSSSPEPSTSSYTGRAVVVVALVAFVTVEFEIASFIAGIAGNWSACGGMAPFWMNGTPGAVRRTKNIRTIYWLAVIESDNKATLPGNPFGFTGINRPLGSIIDGLPLAS